MRTSVLAVAALVAMIVTTPAFAQSARATGTVRDTSGRALKGATVRAMNPDAYPPEIVAVADDRGRWAMIGLRTGTWSFRVQADGFVTVEASTPVRVAGTAPMSFTLARDPGPIPDALAGNIQEQLVAAGTLRDEGRLDQALSAYQDIRSKNPKLTVVNLVLADVYRKKAAQERDPAARRALLDNAIQSYTALLATDGGHARAQSELDLTRAEAAAVR